jgi:tetratricopeptide (TPR) repeat protein
VAREGLEFARRVGNRYWEWSFMAQMYPPFALGDWDEVVAMRAQLPEDDWTQARIAFIGVLTCWLPTQVHRGHVEEAGALLATFGGEFETSADVQERLAYAFGTACVLLAQGRPAEALVAAEAAMDARAAIGISNEVIKESFTVAMEAALKLDDVEKAHELLAIVDGLHAASSPQFLQAQAARFRAQVSARKADTEEAERLFKRAAGRFRELSVPFYLAVTLLEHGEWLAGESRGDEAEPLLAEAREILERLEAAPWLERLQKVVREQVPA